MNLHGLYSGSIGLCTNSVTADYIVMSLSSPLYVRQLIKLQHSVKMHIPGCILPISISCALKRIFNKTKIQEMQNICQIPINQKQKKEVFGKHFQLLLLLAPRLCNPRLCFFLV
jgi:hypothetical protein